MQNRLIMKIHSLIKLFSFPRAAWECRQGALRRESWATSAYTGRSASSTAFPRSTWERGVLEHLCIKMNALRRKRE